MVAINQEYDKTITVKMDLPNSGSLVVASPEQQESQPTSGTLTIPARSVAVVMEQV